MAYMRGQYYLWNDGEGWLHIWASDGYDSWDTTVWACDENEVRREGMENASGVSLPADVMDQYVLMRLAQLIRDGKVEEIIERFLGPEGQRDNVGAMLLEKNAERLKHALSQIQLEVPDTKQGNI